MSEVFDLCENTFKKSMRHVQEQLSNKTVTPDRARTHLSYKVCDSIKLALNDSE
jgi:hypothetical protein